MWQYCMIAFGCLPPRLITIANVVIADRTEANRAAAASSTAPASTRGQLPRAQRPDTANRGVRHRRCEAYLLRRNCKVLDCQIKNEEELWMSSS